MNRAREEIAEMTFQDKIQQIIDNYDSTAPIEMPCPHCQATKDILDVVKQWAISERSTLENIREELSLKKPNDKAGVIILGAKIKMLQQVIDKCHFREAQDDS